MKVRVIFVNVLIDEDYIWKNKIFLYIGLL